MIKRLFGLMVGVVLFLPGTVFAKASVDVYGDSIYAKSFWNILSPDRAAGVPDGLFADFRAENTYLTFDMGEEEEGSGDLLVTMKIFGIGAAGRATLYDGDWNVLTTVAPGAFSPQQILWTVPYSGLTPYRYVKIESIESEEWSIDAIRATQVNSPSVTPTTVEVPDETIPYCVLDCGLAGQLVKLADSSTIYLIGKDEMRHAFPSQSVFDSWSLSSSSAQTLNIEQLAAYSIGKNMTVRPGTYLVKIVHDPKVYAVGTGGVLHWVSTEALANELYGADWNTQVIDVDESFWKNYTVGEPVTKLSEVPTGYTFLDDGVRYIVTKNGTREVNVNEAAELRLEELFSGSVSASDLGTIVVGEENNSDLSELVQGF